MSYFWTHVARGPRYRPVESFPVHLEREASRTPRHIVAEMQDFSREGTKIQSEVRMEAGESIKVELRTDEYQLQLNGRVQWSRGAHGDTYLAGCSFDDVVNWKTIGELFLNGVLSQ